MASRLMIVVAGGSSSRFGRDKLLERIEGKTLIEHTLDVITSTVERCVVVCRPELEAVVTAFDPTIAVAPGGGTRTLSEMSGVAASGGFGDLVGIHDAARPAVTAETIDELFTKAGDVGGAIPVLEMDDLLIEKRTGRAVNGLYRAQTPQVFRGEELRAAYVRAAQAGYDGYDTADVVERFSDLEVAALPGDPANVKVTYPGDVSTVTETLRARSRI